MARPQVASLLCIHWQEIQVIQDPAIVEVLFSVGVFDAETQGKSTGYWFVYCYTKAP